MRALWILVAIVPARLASASDNGLARVPPMGWTACNYLDLSKQDQSLMETIMDHLVDRSRLVDGKPTSLRDLGYMDAHVDDAWQACHEGYHGSFHDVQGNPIINKTMFPDMKAMTDYGHARSLTVSWYANNCGCNEQGFNASMVDLQLQGDVRATLQYGFDGIKLDGCGQKNNLTRWYELFNASGKPIMIENCHWGGDEPNETWCPYNFFRISPDIAYIPADSSLWGNYWMNLQRMDAANAKVRRGCWAYPDALQTGNMVGYYENRLTFGSYVITSAPLILSFDLSDKERVDGVWDIITNREAIAVNHAWAGDPGFKIHSWTPGVVAYPWLLKCNRTDPQQLGWQLTDGRLSIRTTSGVLCLDTYLVDRAEPPILGLNLCTGSSTQQFEFNGSFIKANNQCVRAYNYAWSDGPALALSDCAREAAQLWVMGGDGQLVQRQDMCVAAKTSAPLGVDTMQVWAKRLPDRATALFLANVDKKASHPVTLDLTTLGLPPSVDVRDVWHRKDENIGTGWLNVTISVRDSALLLLRPSCSASPALDKEAVVVI